MIFKSKKETVRYGQKIKNSENMSYEIDGNSDVLELKTVSQIKNETGGL